MHQEDDAKEDRKVCGRKKHRLLSAAPLTTPSAPSGQSLPYVDKPTRVNDSQQIRKVTQIVVFGASLLLEAEVVRIIDYGGGSGSS